MNWPREMMRLMCRQYPLLSGCGKLANSGLLRACSGPPARVPARLRNGVIMLVDTNDFVGRSIYFFGDLDPKITKICRLLLRPGDTFVDVGANYGLVSLYAAKCVGDTGQVHAFEPQVELAGLIRQSAQLNAFRQVAVHPFALSDRSGTATISIRHHNKGVASLNEDFGSGSTSENVVVHKTDDYLRTLHLDSVDLMKLDVEGHEDQVLLGAREFFRDTPPNAIIYEANDSSPVWWQQLKGKLLLDWGYDIFAIPKCTCRFWLQRLQPQTNPPIRSRDFLGIYRGPHYKQILTRLHLDR